MSLNSILSTARSGLQVTQRAVETASHNIANAGSPGYSRQRVRLEPATPLRTPFGNVGRGVTLAGIERVRDSFLDAQYRAEASAMGFQQSGASLLGQVDGVVGELGPGGIGTQLDRFFNAWNDLANNPVGTAQRAAARQAAGDLAFALRGVDSRLRQLGADAQEKLVAGVVEVNRLAAEVAQLNVGIVTSSQNGGAPDLEDQRDAAIDRLSQLVGLQVIKEADNSVTLVAGGFVLAARAQTNPLEVRALQGGGFGVAFTGAPTTSDFRGGELSALIQFGNRTLPDVMRQFDDLAAAVVSRVNAYHSAGQTRTGTTGIPLFDPAGTTASSIGLSTQVQASLDNVVTGSTTAPGDAGVALQIGRLRTENISTLGNRTLGEYMTNVAAGVGQLAKQAEDAVTAQEALVGQIEDRRKSVSSVSIDEELVSLMKSQQNYAAAAKVITTADQMMQAILQMV